jgi:RNA polymerase sigma-32 factor
MAERETGGEPKAAARGPGLPVRASRAMVPATRPAAGPPERKSTFDLYVEEISRVPLLSREEEEELARRFKESGSREDAKRLVEANLRFVVKIAYSYRHYNVKLIDLVQEGNIGLMRAVEKFNPERGYRLISYAVWWIKAYMQNYIIRSWSMVRVGTTQMQRQLFYRLQAEKSGTERELVEETLQEEVPAGEERGETVLVPVVARKQKAETELVKAARDFSLDALVEDDGKLSYVDLLTSPEPPQDEQLAKREILDQVAARLQEVIHTLSDKELYVLQKRLLTDDPETLQEIGEKFGVSRERVRQIESLLKERLMKQLKSIDGAAELARGE